MNHLSVSGILAIGWGGLCLTGGVLLLRVLLRRSAAWKALQEAAKTDPDIAARLTPQARTTVTFLLRAIKIRLFTTISEIFVAISTILLSHGSFTLLGGIFAVFLYITAIVWIILSWMDLHQARPVQ